jgi:hypothetical protein
MCLGLRRLRFAAALAVMATATPAAAKSSLLLPFPTELGPVPAVTFDTHGKPIGRSDFSLEPDGDGRYQLQVTMRITRGAQSRVRAEFEVVEPKSGSERRLRTLVEESQSFHADGSPMTLLRIDHTTGVASCIPPLGSGAETRTLKLPAEDRVANVPMHLLFLPLVRGEVSRIHFQLFVCRGGPKIHEFVALRGGPPVESGDRTIQEVRYGPDLGTVVSWVASRVLPKLSFWFDTRHGDEYIAHQMPIYSKGPEILMIRDGVDPHALGRAF